MRDGEGFWRRVHERMADREIANLADLARAVGTKYHTLYSAEDRRSIPKAPVDQAIADVVGSPLRWLESGDGDREIATEGTSYAVPAILGEIARIMRQLDEPGRDALLGRARTLELEQQERERRSRGKEGGGSSDGS